MKIILEENKKITNYKTLLDIGLELARKTKIIMDTDYDNRDYTLAEADASFDIVEGYHKWVKNIQEFFKANYKDEIETSVFKEVDDIPSMDWLDEHHYIIGDPIPFSLAEKILVETKKKLEHLRDTARRNPKILKLTQKEGLQKISVIEFLINDQGVYKVYLNENYTTDPLRINQKKFWDQLFELTTHKEVAYDRGFFDYFTSNKKNPIYKKYAVTKIFRKQGDRIIREIKIKTTTQNKVTRSKNRA